MHSRIYLIGFMGSGKTTHGKQIARMMGYRFIDMDQWISEKENKSITEIFESEGEEHFRMLESKAISEMENQDKAVVATGGGLPCFGENLQRLKNSGLTIYLKLTPAALVHRLKNAKTKRPLLAGKDDSELLAIIEELLAEREFYYSKADMIIDGLDRVNERVVNAIQRR